MNPNNNLTIVGRLANDPKFFPNQDGSRTVLLTIYAQDNFKSGGEYRSQALPVEIFLPASWGNQPYDLIGQGDLVNMAAHLEMQTYERNGSQVYDLKVVGDRIALLESKATTQARRAQKAQQAQQPQAQAQTAQFAPQGGYGQQAQAQTAPQQQAQPPAGDDEVAAILAQYGEGFPG